MSPRPQRQRPPASAPLLAAREPLHIGGVTPPAEEAGQSAPAVAPPPAPPARVKRGIQIAADVAETYDELLEDLAYEYRIPKGHVVDALLRVASAHLDEVRERLGAESDRQQPRRL